MCIILEYIALIILIIVVFSVLSNPIKYVNNAYIILVITKEATILPTPINILEKK